MSIVSVVIKDTIYTKLVLMAWLDDKLGHAPSGLVIIAKTDVNLTNTSYFIKISSVAQLVERQPQEQGVMSSIPHQGKNFSFFFIWLKLIFKLLKPNFFNEQSSL